MRMRENPYSVRLREKTDQKKTRSLDTFHAVKVTNKVLVIQGLSTTTTKNYIKIKIKTGGNAEFDRIIFFDTYQNQTKCVEQTLGNFQTDLHFTQNFNEGALWQ